MCNGCFNIFDTHGEAGAFAGILGDAGLVVYQKIKYNRRRDPKIGGKMPPYLRTSTKLPFFGGRFRGTLGRSNLSLGQRFVHNVDGEASEWVGLLLEINHPRWDSECTIGFDKLCVRRGVMYQEGILKKEVVGDRTVSGLILFVKVVTSSEIMSGCIVVFKGNKANKIKMRCRESWQGYLKGV